MVSSDFDVRDSQVILGMALMSPESQSLAWNFYQTHFDALTQRLRSDELGRLIGQTGGGITSGSRRKGRRRFPTNPSSLRLTFPGPGH
ncbi:hypothetical protein [Corallococcus sicarius]|uniref:hypothetical protein n=1 Tax=Corallococcus sicarius TaxID=2316726 RepID=UPI0031343E6B